MVATTARGYSAVLWGRRERAGLVQPIVLGYIFGVERGCQEEERLSSCANMKSSESWTAELCDGGKGSAPVHTSVPVSWDQRASVKAAVIGEPRTASRVGL
jgi:hypothetical protein